MSIIIDRAQVELNKHQHRVVAQMYSEAVIENTMVENITYNSDGLKVKGYIATPKAEGSYPVILWNRGGYKDQGALDDLTAYLILASTAVWGYVMIATQYRGNRGSEGKEHWGGHDLDDALNLLKAIDELPNADPKRVAIEGASRGGMTTYRALAVEHRFKCAIVHAGLADLFEMESWREDFGQLVEKISRDMTVEEKQQCLAGVSGVYLAEKFPKNCPILLMHGDNDLRVPISQSEAMARELKRLGIPYSFEVIKGGGHVALKDGSYKQVDILRKAWLEKYL